MSTVLCRRVPRLVNVVKNTKMSAHRDVELPSSMRSQRDQRMSSPELVLGYRVVVFESVTSGITSSSRLNTAPSVSSIGYCCALQVAPCSVLTSLPRRLVDSLPISGPRLREDEDVLDGVRKLPKDSGRDTRGGVGEADGMGMDEGT